MAQPGRAVGGRASTVLGRKLGGELLELREAAGLTQPAAAAALSATQTKIVKMERGWVPVRDPDLLSLCSLYGVAEETRVAGLLLLARADRERRRAKGWWRQYPELGALVEYVALEDVAVQVRTWQIAFVPGLFQTPDYARALAVGNAAWSDPDEIERFVEARLARQARLEEANPLQIWAVLSEAVLRQQVGGPAAMRAQLARLRELTAHPQVKLQVLPFLAGAHPGMTSAFNIVSFAENGAMDVVYMDTTASSLWLESEADAARHGVLFDRIVRQSLSQASSADLIDRIREET
jgi:DNA-binding XRE family transcriptional regulator